MTWAKQRQLVKMLSDRAQEKRRQARHVRGNMKAWMSSYLGNLETLAWIFAMGSFWAAGRSPAKENSAARRSMMAAINTSLLAWQLVNRQVNIPQPTSGYRSVEQR
jgi:hypothetical protein